MKKMAWMAFAICYILLMVSCKLLDRALTRTQVRIVPARTNLVVLTNYEIVTLTNVITHDISTNLVQAITIITNVTPEHVTTNLVANPAVTATGDLVKTLPFPWAGAAGGAVGWAATAWAALRQRQVAVAVIKSVEAGRTVIRSSGPTGPQLDQAFTAALASHQDAAGVQPVVNNILAKHIDN